jgi:hypothetical protein
LGIRVGLVIEHPDSSTARMTAPSSFAAPGQLGCGSLRRRWEAASAPAVRRPVSVGARRGGASAHFEQRPVTSLHPSRSSAPALEPQPVSHMSKQPSCISAGAARSRRAHRSPPCSS